VKLDLTRKASPVFDVTNKMFKDHDHKIYYFQCDDESITMKALCLEEMKVKDIKTYPIGNAQAVLFYHDIGHVSHKTEKSFLDA